MPKTRFAIVVLVAAGAGCGGPTDPHAPPPTRFANPIVGQPLAQLFYGAYIDDGGRDFHCGVKYYAGHLGTDILLRNFQVQDSGVTVVAAAAGQVEGVHDGEPDRNTVNNASRAWNFVSIRHPDGVLSMYGHLRRGSPRVAVGDQVAAGTPLGLVGSSGNSNWPHLHFEVRTPAGVLDPWAGACGAATSLWSDQLAYQDEFRVMDSGILDRGAGGLADLLERPPDREPVTGSAGVVSYWAELFNVQAGPLRAEYYAPDGSLAGAVEYPTFTTFSATFAVVTIPVAPGAPAGRYTVVLLARPLSGGVLAEVARRNFTLTAAVRAQPGGGAAATGRLSLAVFSLGPDGRP